MRHWIFSCKKVSGMISESMDRQLSLFQRMGVRFHLMMCKLCTRYQKQLLFIGETLRLGGNGKPREDNSTLPGLSYEARKRIQKHLLDKTKDSS